MSSCVLCGLGIVKNTDKNLVDGRRGNPFNVREELLSLEYKVEINSPYICRNCLSVLKKRRALSTNLREVNNTIQKIFLAKKSSVNPVPVNVITSQSSNQSSSFQEQAAKRVALEDSSASVTLDDSSAFTSKTSADQLSSILTSTPCKEKSRPVDIAAFAGPVSPIPAREVDVEEKKTVVQVSIKWPSRPNAKVNNLHEGLESLGKMLCRGTYKQIARAVWKNPILRKHVQQLYLEEVDRECTAMCSLKNPSCLRSPSKKDLQSFSLKKFNTELESKAPLFSAVLWTASVRKSKRDDRFWQPSVCMSAAVLLKNRSPCMNAMQLINTITLYHSGIIGSLCRLGSLRVTTGHSYYYKKLDEFGKDHAASVQKKVKEETARLEKKHRAPTNAPSATISHPAVEEPQPEQAVIISADKGRKLVFDNFDFKQQVHYMTEEHQNVDVHWVSHLSVENRVSGNHLSSDKPATEALMQMENGLCLPSRHEHHLQRENYITLTERAVVEIPCLSFLKPVVCKHIPHQYSKEMADKSEMNFLGMLYHNENDADGIQQVLTELHQYVPYYGDGDERVYSSQGYVADQLSVERGVNALFELANGFTPEERLEGIHLEIADWHSGNKFLKVAFKNFYDTKSSGDKCTLYSDRNLINRRNVRADVDAAVNPCRKFFDLEVKARLIAAAVHELGMDGISDSPKGEYFRPDLPEASNMERKEYVRKIATRIVDGYVIQRENVEKIFNSLLAAEAVEEEEARCQTDDGRYICFFPGCGKTFACRGKRMSDHESTHNQQIPSSDSQGLLFSSDMAPSDKVPEKDDMFNYQCSFLEYGMLILNFFDAIKEGDGKRIFRCWKFQLPYLRMDPGSTKYALEALGMIFQVHALLSPKSSHELIWNRTAQLKSGLGKNIPLDLLLEFFNRLLKEVRKKLGPNATNHKAMDRYCHAIDFTKVLLDNFDQECCVIRRSGHHYELSVESDLRKVVSELITQKAFCWTPGRTYAHFGDTKSTLLSNFDLQDMFRWINKHKRNISRQRKAR
ncbi:uncharacterized protein LOC144647887 [Oculina patagonica]